MLDYLVYSISYMNTITRWWKWAASKRAKALYSNVSKKNFCSVEGTSINKHDDVNDGVPNSTVLKLTSSTVNTL